MPLKVCVDPVCGTDADGEHRLWGACLLLQQCLSEAHVYESSATARVLDRVGVLVADLEHKLLSPLLEHAQRGSNNKVSWSASWTGWGRWWPIWSTSCSVRC